MSRKQVSASRKDTQVPRKDTRVSRKDTCVTVGFACLDGSDDEEAVIYLLLYYSQA